MDNKQNDIKFRSGAVVILDALGTKGIWNRSEAGIIIGKWQSVTEDFKTSLDDLNVLIKHLNSEIQMNWVKVVNPDNPVIGECIIKLFSDTIIITLEGDSEYICLYFLANFLRGPFCRAILREIYFRGVISYGKYFQTESFILGPAIDEAAEWHSFANWIGISAAPSANFILSYMFEEALEKKALGDNSLFEIMGEEKFYVRYNIPLKNGEYNGWALNWPTVMETWKKKDDKAAKDLNSKISLLKSFAGRSVDINSISKYKNTIDFFEYVLNKQGNNGNQ
jgi:hypothetical protein